MAHNIKSINSKDSLSARADVMKHYRYRDQLHGEDYDPRHWFETKILDLQGIVQESWIKL